MYKLTKKQNMWISKTRNRNRVSKNVTFKELQVLKRLNNALWNSWVVKANTTQKNYYCRIFAWRLLNSFNWLKEWHLFYSKYNEHIYKSDDMLMPITGNLYLHDEWDTLKIELSWISAEVVGSHSIEVSYPLYSNHRHLAVRINDDFMRYTVKDYLIKNNIITDDYYQVLRSVLSNFNILYYETWRCIWLEPRDIKLVKGNIDYEDLLLKEIEQWYINDVIWDKREKYKWWYTHILRSNLKMKLQKWQISLLYNWNKWVIVIWSRQVWKTYTSAFIAYREFWRSDKWYAGRDRLTLYVSATIEKMYAPKRYFESMISKDIEAWLIRAISSKWLYKNLITWAELKFISAESKGWADSFFADACILDEWPMISNDYWNNLLAILIQQNANVFAIWTIDENSIKNWFYETAILWEIWEDPDIYTLRVTIDENELATESAKNKLKKSYKPFPMLYWCKLYATFPSTWNLFNLEWVIRQLEVNTHETAIIWYDPAKTSDNPWLVVLDPFTFNVTQEHKMKWLSYKEQHIYIKSLCKTFNKAIVIMDRRWVWEAVFEIMEDIIDVSVYYTTTKKAKFDQSTWWWSVQKKELVDTVALYLSIYWLHINMWLTNLIAELKWFKKIQVWKSILYEGVWVTDDSVNSLMLIVFYLSTIVKTTKPIDVKPTTVSIDYEYEPWFNVKINNNKDDQISNRMKSYWY